VISSRVPRSSNSHSTWTVKSLCRKGGECDATVTSSGGWRKRAAFLAGRYRWSRTVPKAESCGTPGNIQYYITSIDEYSVSMTQMALVRNQWVATSFDGTFINQSTRGCGLSGPGVDERDTLDGTLIR
jgi:hypothetical protein